MPDAFKHHDGEVVPLVWNHDHSDPNNILGKVLLHSRDGGLYAYCQFNETESGQAAKELVRHGDICSLSIWANQLKHNAGRGVMHGMVREVSLVLAGANKGARIESVIMRHGDEFGVDDPVRELADDEGIIYSGENLTLYHAAEQQKEEESDMAEETKKEKTVKEVFDELTEEQKNVVYAMIGQALEDAGAGDEDDDEEDNNMRHSVFDNSNNNERQDCVLSHADQQEILALAKNPGVGSLKAAMEIYAEQHSDTLAHGTWENIGQLFPDFKDIHPGAPELLERDMSWVGSVMKKTKKSPVARVRTRQADGRATALRAKGYNDRSIEKKIGGSLKLYLRTTEPTTVYVRDTLHRDDIIDVTDFDVVAYQKTVMKHNMEEVIALAALVGDLREDTDPDKIDEEKIRPVWKDDELYTIHYDIDIAKAKAELQGSNTSANFGENYIRAEALVAASLYASEKYKGKGAKTMYIDPHELNVMLLARDLNGRRIYDSKADLAKAFNVDEIETVEQFNGLTRQTADGKTKKLLCLIVNMGNYQFGSAKGGELTSFDDFDIKFNTFEYLMETRVSGALTEVFSAIAIEEDVTDAE
jgi:HK97 family phage prohead protease